jgi:hypothetical protein
MAFPKLFSSLLTHHADEPFWKDRGYLRKVLLGLFLFTVSCIVNFYAGTYATREARSSVTDIVLSNTPIYDVDGMFIYGALVLIAFIVLLCFYKPRRAPFVLLSLSVFIFIRSCFISLTHIGPFPDRLAIDVGSVTSKFIFGGDLFFSGHTGIPFLMALVFWRERPLRYIFLAWSIFFGIIVLLGHIHYSIDVLSAFFITYTIYQIASFFFPSERVMLEG